MDSPATLYLPFETSYVLKLLYYNYPESTGHERMGETTGMRRALETDRGLVQ